MLRRAAWRFKPSGTRCRSRCRTCSFSYCFKPQILCKDFSNTAGSNPLPDSRQVEGPNPLRTRVLAFGDGSFGQLGNGLRYGFEASPTHVDFGVDLASDPIVSIAAGDYHSLAVTSGGALYSWGWATFQGSESMSPGSGGNDALPQRVQGELAQRHVSFAAGGRRHSLAMTKDNNLFAFGVGENGQLGLGNTNNSRAPQRVPHFSGVPLALVTAGWGHSVAITTEGEVLTWGWNEEAQCGLGTTQQMILEPTEIKSLRGVKIVQAAAGADHTILVDDKGNLFGFGSAKMHQIGTGSLNNVAHPVQLKAFPTTQEAFKGVSCGFGHTIAITETGKVFSCGYNPDGQCGTGTTGTVEMLTQIEIPDGAKIVSASCGRLSTVLTDNEGRLYSFGNATNGRLGNGSRRKALDPNPVELEEGQALMSASGMDHTIVLTSS